MEARPPITDEASYDAALAEVDQFFIQEPKRGSPEADRFTELVEQIEAYEAQAWPVPDAIERLEGR